MISMSNHLTLPNLVYTFDLSQSFLNVAFFKSAIALGTLFTLIPLGGAYPCQTREVVQNSQLDGAVSC